MFLFSWMPKEGEYPAETLHGPAILQDLKKRAESFNEPFNLFFQSIPDGTKCWHNRLSYWVPEPWDNRNGTVTLVGDAAHPMTFRVLSRTAWTPLDDVANLLIDRGQGLNNAIHDVASLARSLKEKGITPSAVSDYEQAMRKRGREAVISSNKNSLAVHNWDTLMQSALLTVGGKQDG